LSDNHKIEPNAWPPYAAAAAVEINELPSAAPRSAVRGGIATWPPREWGDKWRAPYVPHHMALGDPLARKSKVDYIANGEADRVMMTRQKVGVQLRLMQDRLPTCVTAQQGVAVLSEIRAFLQSEQVMRAEGSSVVVREPKVRLVDAKAVLKQVRNLRLPFEYLVRSVWEEGPEVEYDRTKASLVRLLQQEIARRKRLEDEAAANKAPVVPASSKTRTGRRLAANIEGFVPPRPATTPGGPRLGLLSFYGSEAVTNIGASTKSFADM